MFVFGMMSYIT